MILATAAPVISTSDVTGVKIMAEKNEQTNPQQVELGEDSNVDHEEAQRQLREGEARALGAYPAESEEDDPWDREQAHVNPFQE